MYIIKYIMSDEVILWLKRAICLSSFPVQDIVAFMEILEKKQLTIRTSWTGSRFPHLLPNKCSCISERYNSSNIWSFSPLHLHSHSVEMEVQPCCFLCLLIDTCLLSVSSLSQSACWVPGTSVCQMSGTPGSEWPGTRYQLLSRATDSSTLLQVRPLTHPTHSTHPTLVFMSHCCHLVRCCGWRWIEDFKKWFLNLATMS